MVHLKDVGKSRTNSYCVVVIIKIPNTIYYCSLQVLITFCLISTWSTSPCCLPTEKPVMSASVRGNTVWLGKSTVSVCPTASVHTCTDSGLAWVLSAPARLPSICKTKEKKNLKTNLLPLHCEDLWASFSFWVRMIESSSVLIKS